MSEGQFVSDTIESVLVGMAESLRDAQEALSSSPSLDQYGRIAPQYQIPHLDFEIGFKLLTEQKQGGRARLFFKPVTAGQTSREVTTKLTGKFVAVPAGDGLPLPVLNVQTKALSSAEHELVITVRNSANEIMSDIAVEINYDPVTSAALSASAGVARPRLNNGVTIQNAVPVTDEAGIARTKIILGKNVAKKAQIVLTAEVGPEQTLMALSKADAS